MDEPSDYLYVVLESNGQCSAVRDGRAERIDGVPALLREGWRPVRETPFSGSGAALPCVLILFERDGRDPRGFGFRP